MPDNTQDVTTDASAQDADVSGSVTDEQEPSPTGFDALPEATKTEIRNLRRENAKYRNQVKEFEDATKSDIQRAQEERDSIRSRYDALEAKYRDSLALSSFSAAATRAGALDGETLYLAFKGRLEFDDDGVPTNVDAVIDGLKRDKPGLFKAATGRTDGGTKVGTGTGMTINDALREMAANAPR